MGDQAVFEFPWRHIDGYHCFGCSPDNPAGLALTTIETAAGLACRFALTRLHESYPGIIHGGIAATLLDELMANLLAVREQRFCVTVGLRVRFLASLRTDREYYAQAHLVERPADPDARFRVASEILDAENEPAVVASGSYQWLTAEQAKTLIGLTDPAASAFQHYFREPRARSDS
jgi:acyl-coenzyme A thioesterase PaaI-like protein